MRVSFGVVLATILLSSPAQAQTAGVYQWVTAASPPANVVTAPDSPNTPVCRGHSQEQDRILVGSWTNASTGTNTICTGVIAGFSMPLEDQVQFLVVVSGTATWLAGQPKVQPADIGTIPADAISAGPFYAGGPQIICSHGGYVSYVYYNGCSDAPEWGLSQMQQATVLVGTLASGLKTVRKARPKNRRTGR